MSSFKDRVSDTAGLIIIRGPAWGEDEGKEGLVGDLLGDEDALAEKMAEPVRKFSDDQPRAPNGEWGGGGGGGKKTQSGKDIHHGSHEAYATSTGKKKTSDKKRVDAVMAAHPGWTGQDHKDAAREHASDKSVVNGIHLSQLHALAAARLGVP